jgi:heme O synthase-like polyprenyltransferase
MTLYALVVIGTLVPFVMRWVGATYLILAIAADISLAYFALRLQRSVTPEDGRRQIRRLYLTALGLVAAFLVGSLL